jgi:hypothetical protein
LIYYTLSNINIETAYPLYDFLYKYLTTYMFLILIDFFVF